MFCELLYAKAGTVFIVVSVLCAGMRIT